MDWPMGYDGADVQVWAESAASTYWWSLLGWAAGALILLFSIEHIVAIFHGTEVEPAWH